MLWDVLGISRLCAGDLGHSRSVSRRVHSIFFFFCNFYMREFILYCIFCILITRTLSSGSCAAALDGEYVSTYFWPHLKGGFLVVFRIWRSTVSIS